MTEEPKDNEQPPKSLAQMPASVNPPEFYFEATVRQVRVGTGEVISQETAKLGHNYLLVCMELQNATPEQVAQKRVPIGFMVKSNFDPSKSKEHFGGILTPLFGFLQQYYQSCIQVLQKENKIIIAKGNPPLPNPQRPFPPFKPPLGRGKR